MAYKLNKKLWVGWTIGSFLLSALMALLSQDPFAFGLFIIAMIILVLMEFTIWVCSFIKD